MRAHSRQFFELNGHAIRRPEGGRRNANVPANPGVYRDDRCVDGSLLARAVFRRVKATRAYTIRNPRHDGPERAKIAAAAASGDAHRQGEI